MRQGWRNGYRLASVLLASACLAACATARYPVHAENPSSGPRYKVGAPYEVNGVWYTPREQPDYDQRGVASWYGDAFNMKATANGELFDMTAVTAAHATLPMPSIVEVTNLDNGRKLNVRVNDRGPFAGGRIIDVSHEAARELGFDRQGLAHVRVRYVGPAPLLGPAAGLRYAYNTAKTPKLANLPGRPATNPPITGADLPPIQVSNPGGPVAGLPRPGSSEADPPTSSLPGTALTTPDLPQVATVAAPEPIGLQPLGPVTPVPSVPAATSEAFASVGTGAGQRAAGVGSAPPAPAEGSPVPAAATTGYRIQVGAFSDFLNARRAADMLAGQGKAIIEPSQRGGVTLYRVMVPGPADEAEAFALRDKVASLGFSDARVLRPPAS